ncbi:uncharacterized protein LOC117110292 [Anneissia japonica]|uniref:uncharacterized protein LOC117110292 n=1 Tax=Anneissia japonica TaxID=1529436 RepID=UPI001425A491|nr:uncharacterized protein LOC117110292 [Anneissia japonica]
MRNMDEIYTDSSDLDFSDSDAEIDNNIGTQMHCICEQNSDDEMIACSGPNCTIKWYHFNCVGLTSDSFPDGDWACEQCVAASTSADPSDRPGPSLASIPSVEKGRKQKSKANQDGTCGETNTPKEKKGKKSKRPASVFTKEDAEREVKGLINSALAALECHPIYSGPFANKDKILGLITLLRTYNDDELACFTGLLVSEVWDAIRCADNLCLGPEMYERITINIHTIMFNAKLREAWDAVTNTENAIINGIVLMFVVKHVATNMMRLRNEKDKSKVDSY